MMNGMLCMKFLKKVGSFMEILNRSDTGGLIAKQKFSLQNASFTSLLPSSSIITIQSNQLFGKDTNCQSQALKQPQTNQLRTVTKFSLQKGARKSVKPVRNRFFRLHWGIWIRTIAGRSNKLWKKTNRRKNAIFQHVFCNSTQSKMLDKMVNRFWRVPKYYIEDPYEPYHKRENYFFTQRKPWRPDDVDYE